jgi:hypothetical protein
MNGASQNSVTGETLVDPVKDGNILEIGIYTYLSNLLQQTSPLILNYLIEVDVAATSNCFTQGKLVVSLRQQRRAHLTMAKSCEFLRSLFQDNKEKMMPIQR